MEKAGLSGYNGIMNDTRFLLARGLAALDVDGMDRATELLLRYLAQIEAWNPAYGLVNASGDELVIKHILDSLAPFRILQNLLAERDALLAEKAGGTAGTPPAASSVSDIGTGAGLPGIPLAIAMPERRFRLVERMGKRITFLESQKVKLGLDNVEIVESEIERAPGPHDLVVFRAFRPFAELKLFRSVWKNLSPGGAFLAWKGKQMNARMEVAEMATDPVLSEPFSKAEIRPVWVPFLNEERCVVIVRKPFD
jgi:16S rRNA (guanine527-N7)-methyltransferase